MATLNEQPIRVLIVDDDPRLALTLAASIERLEPEFFVETAFSFSEAFDKVQRTQYGLVMVDHEMPDLSGLDLARAVRHVSPDSQVVLMTASGTQALRDTARLLGLIGCLEKPLTIVQMRELVQRTATATTPIRRVLLMEDKDDLRHVYSSALRGAGYRVHEVTSLQEARDLLAVRQFDIFICALHLGGEPILNLIREQRPKLNQAGTYVIAISAEGGHRSNWEEMGVDFYLETPIATNPLVTLVDRLTTQR
jgi:DNA-binding response OmpR family regulator